MSSWGDRIRWAGSVVLALHPAGICYNCRSEALANGTVRRLVQQEDYALSLMARAGLPSPTPYGFVELTPDREYLLVTEFFEGAVELGEAQVDEQIIDDGLSIIRRLWDAGWRTGISSRPTCWSATATCC
jgi:hypothetical protein